jgi:hypothetical protein
MKSVTILTPCYNEEANVEPLYERVRQIMVDVGRYNYEHRFHGGRLFVHPAADAPGQDHHFHSAPNRLPCRIIESRA